MNRVQVNEMAKILEAEERRRGAPDRRLATHEVLKTLFEERNTVLERQVAERSSDLARSQENVRSLSAKLDLVEQRERKQLAGELHDYLAQLLVLGHMKVGELRRLTCLQSEWFYPRIVKSELSASSVEFQATAPSTCT